MKNVSQETIDLALSFVKAKVGQKPDGTDYTLADVQSVLRKAHLVQARMWFSWYLRVQKQFSFPRIGAILLRDHSSIMHLVAVCNERQGLPDNYPLNEWQRAKVLHLQQNWGRICELHTNGMTGDQISLFLKVPPDQVYAVLFESGLIEKQPIEPMPQYVQRFREEMADA